VSPSPSEVRLKRSSQLLLGDPKLMFLVVGYKHCTAAATQAVPRGLAMHGLAAGSVVAVSLSLGIFGTLPGKTLWIDAPLNASMILKPMRLLTQDLSTQDLAAVAKGANIYLWY